MTLRTFLSRTIIGTAAIIFSASAYAAPFTIDTAKSHITITFTQLGVAVDAQFKKFSAHLDVDPAHMEKTKAKVDIDIASFDVGQAQYNQEVLKKEWFNATQFPKASFTATAFKPIAGKPAGTHYTVTGKLTIKGTTHEVRFPMSYQRDGKTALLAGTLPIQRLAYNIGEDDWEETGLVADVVAIQFHLVGTP